LYVKEILTTEYTILPISFNAQFWHRVMSISAPADDASCRCMLYEQSW
jgi:hypothetical protein